LAATALPALMLASVSAAMISGNQPLSLFECQILYAGQCRDRFALVGAQVVAIRNLGSPRKSSEAATRLTNASHRVLIFCSSALYVVTLVLLNAQCHANDATPAGGQPEAAGGVAAAAGLGSPAHQCSCCAWSDLWKLLPATHGLLCASWTIATLLLATVWRQPPNSLPAGAPGAVCTPPL
jgi:hypothetical protein